MLEKMGETLNSSDQFQGDINFVEDLIKKHENGEMVGYSIYDFKSEKAKKVVDAFLNSKKKSKVANIGLELKSLLTGLKSSEFNQEKTNEGGFFNKIKQAILKLVGKTNSKLVKTLNDDINVNEISLDKALGECNRHIRAHRYKNAKKFLEFIVKKTNQGDVNVSDLKVGNISKSKDDFNRVHDELESHIATKEYKKALTFLEALIGEDKKLEKQTNKNKVDRWGRDDKEAIKKSA